MSVEAADALEVELSSSWRYQDAKSNKVYKIMLVARGGGWMANYAFGKYGTSLSEGCKSGKAPVPYAKARKVYDSMVAERLSKGYWPEEDGGAGHVYVGAERRHSGIQCQNPAEIDEDEAQRLTGDDGWFAEEKKDGKRRLIRKAETVEGINKKGLVCGFPMEIHDAALAVDRSFVVDGEEVGCVLHAFDLLELDGRDLRGEPAERRYALLRGLFGGDGEGAIRVVEAAFTTAEKRALYERLRAEEREGVVFKRRDAPYVPGKPSSGGSQLKRKLWAACSAVVEALNDKRSVSLKLLDGGAWVSVGSVTIPTNAEVPEVGAVVEVKYLYAYVGGALAQTSYLGPRDDVDAEECVVGQLKYKAD